MSAYGRCWWCAVVALGALGAFEALLAVEPLALWTIASTVGGLSALLVVLHHLHRRSQPGYAPNLVRTAVEGAVSGIVVTGLASLLGGMTTPLLVALACLHPRVLVGVASWTWRRLQATDEAAPEATDGSGLRTPPAPVRPAARPTGPRPGGSTRPRDWASKVIPRTPPAEGGWPDEAGMRLLSTAQLCWGWRVSFTALQRTDLGLERGRFVTLVAVRRRYLDELARREPDGFARWLYSGARPASDPSRYLLGLSARPASTRPGTQARATGPGAASDQRGRRA